MSRNPKAFFGTQIEFPHVKFISVSGIQFKIYVAGSFQIMNMLRGALPLLRT